MKLSRAGMARWCSFAWVSALPRRNQTMLSSTRGSSSMYRVSSCAAPAQSLRRKAALPRSRAPCAILAFMPTARSSSALASRREMSCRARWSAWSMASVCPGPSFSDPSRSYARAAFSLASRRELSPRRNVSTSCVSCFTLPSFAAASSLAPRISLRAKVKAPRVAMAAKRKYAATLVIMCRFSKSSCLRPICLSSACRFFRRLSVLMTRLRASITSLRSREMSPSWPAGSGWDTLRGELVSSLILICLGKAWVGPEHPMERTFVHLSCCGADDLPAGRLPLVVRLQEMEHQPEGEQVSAHRQLPLALRVDLRVGERVSVLEHHREGSCHLETDAQPEICRG